MFNPKYAANILRPLLRVRARRGQMQWSAIGRIAGRQVRRSLSDWTIYGLVTVALGIVVGLLYCTVWFAGESGLYVHSRPFVLPMQVVTTVGYLFVMFGAALSQVPSRRGEMRRPDWSAGGDRPTMVTARFLAWVIVYGFLLLILIPILVLVTRGANLVIPSALLWGLIPSLVCAGLAVSLGLFIAATALTREVAMAIAAAVVVTSLALQNGHLILASLPVPNPYQTMLPLLRAGQQLFTYVSPFVASGAMLDVALRADIPALLRLVLITLISVILWLTATLITLRRRENLP